MRRMTATIRDIDPERDPILMLDCMDCLSKRQQVQRIKVMQPDGTLVDNVNATFERYKSLSCKSQTLLPTECLLRVQKLAGLWDA